MNQSLQRREENSNLLLICTDITDSIKSKAKNKKSIKVCVLFSVPSQLWKLDGNTLKNKSNLWISHMWKFKTSGKFVYIKHIVNKKILEITKDGSVVEGDFVKDKPAQLWKKGTSDADGYFILENTDTPKVLTAVSPSRLEIKGNSKLSKPLGDG